MSNMTLIYPSPEVNGDRNAFARHAATASLAAPLFIIALNVACRSLLQANPDGSSRSLILVQGRLSLILMIASLILGMLALGLMKSGGRRAIFLRATAGILLSGLFLASFVPNFVRARTTTVSQRQSGDEFHAAKDFKSETAKAPGDDPAPDANHPAQSSDRAAIVPAAAFPKDTIKDTTLFVQHRQALQSNYARASRELTAADVLRGQDLTARVQLQDRKSIVQSFLEANASLRKEVEADDENFREELRRQDAAAAETNFTRDGYLKSITARRPLVMEIRDADDRICAAMLGNLELLDANWGQWHFDPANNRKVFKSEAVLQKYSANLQTIDNARQAELVAQRKLASLMSRQIAGR